MPRSKRNGKRRVLSKLEEGTTVCSYIGCGKSFGRPIEVRVIGPDNAPKIYDACPYCFSRVIHPNQDPKPVEKISLPTITSNEDLDKEQGSEKKGKPTGCSHSFGYLSNRPKGTSIPDSCLTCPKITKCMLQ